MNARAAGRIAVAFVAYLIIAAVYSHPLLERRRDAIANDRYDPVLNASILWWNATTLPFSPAWWTPPHYYPSEGIAAFTEHLVGLGVITTPVQRITGDPVLTYNLAVFLTWPLSAMAVFLLALGLGARPGPAFAGGLAFGLAPYRIGQMAHLQVLACFWLPLALLGLHGYLQDRRTRWLVLFGVAWLLQSLTNGYFMLFGAVLIAMWLAYFCSTKATWRLAAPIVAAWGLASLPLVPVLLKYKAVHSEYGLERGLGAILHYSAEPLAWFRVSELAVFWRGTLRDAGGEWNLFPGATVVSIVLAAIAWTLVTRRQLLPAASQPPVGRLPPARRLLAIAAAVVATVCWGVILITLAAGPWRVAPFGFAIRVSSIDREVVLAILSTVVFLLTRRDRTRLAVDRSAFGFYVLATVAIAVFCLGPQIRVDSRVILDTAPYRWLMVFPGFEGLRVPTRFWMIGALCLATAAALGLDRLAPPNRWGRALLVILASSGIAADGWIREMPMGRSPEHWPRVERRDTDRAVLEVPLGPEFDAAATFRAVRHRRRVVNGVSGYDPPHYGLLQRGLNAHDPSVLLALARLGPIDVIVDGSADRDGALGRYVAGIAGARPAGTDGVRTAYRLPDHAEEREPARHVVPVSSVRSSIGTADVRFLTDDDLATEWTVAPQHTGASLTVDLGSVAAVGGLMHSLGGNINGYPRSLAVDVSLDGETWGTAWEGAGLGETLLALMRTPREARIALRFEPRPARFVRLRLTSTAEAVWAIAELRILAAGTTAVPVRSP